MESYFPVMVAAEECQRVFFLDMRSLRNVTFTCNHRIDTFFWLRARRFYAFGMNLVMKILKFILRRCRGRYA